MTRNSRSLVSEANSRSFSTLHVPLSTLHGSQEHTPRRQEHAATPLAEGIQDQKQKSVPELGALFLVPTLRVQVLG